LSEVNAREMALIVLKAVDQEGAYANIALNQVLEQRDFNKLDRAFTTELVYGTLRALNTVDWVLAQFLKHPLSSQTAWIRNILRLGTYQLLFMHRVPASAACNEAAKLSHKYGHKGQVKFVNGVLRNIARQHENIEYPDCEKDPVSHISLRYSHPIWMVERWLNQFGKEKTIRICQSNNTPARFSIRTNTLQINRDNLAELLKQQGMIVDKTGFAPEGLNVEGFTSLRNFPAFRNGLFQVQDESSILAGHAVKPAVNCRVIDACAAPGGKTTHLAQLMENKGEIIAADIYPHKLDLIEDNCQRLGIKCVKIINLDSRTLHNSYTGWADYVLVDAPCSGLGVLRRRPDARWRKEAEQIPALVKIQREILESAALCVRPGGVLVYSTCTITEEENIEQVKYFLLTHLDFVLEDMSRLLPSEIDWQNTLGKGYIQILPYTHNIDGFFIARMRKKRV
jgi:16S rRNA (cytosine967-C5)-methyltransferase